MGLGPATVLGWAPGGTLFNHFTTFGCSGITGCCALREWLGFVAPSCDGPSFETPLCHLTISGRSPLTACCAEGPGFVAPSCGGSFFKTPFRHFSMSSRSSPLTGWCAGCCGAVFGGAFEPISCPFRRSGVTGSTGGFFGSGTTFEGGGGL